MTRWRCTLPSIWSLNHKKNSIKQRTLAPLMIQHCSDQKNFYQRDIWSHDDILRRWKLKRKERKNVYRFFCSRWSKGHGDRNRYLSSWFQSNADNALISVKCTSKTIDFAEEFQIDFFLLLFLGLEDRPLPKEKENEIRSILIENWFFNLRWPLVFERVDHGTLKTKEKNRNVFIIFHHWLNERSEANRISFQFFILTLAQPSH